jgi:hypothetical protein
MPQINRVALVVLLWLCPTIVAAPAVTRITRAKIDGHLRFLSSDLLDRSRRQAAQP